MKSLKIEFTGGFRQVSKHLTREHSANFAVIIDSIVYIHNENSANLANINGNLAVRISNAYLSRHTGLGLSTIKGNIEKAESIGLVTVITKGQGNTRHYIINIENINAYIAALQPKFKQWFEKSMVSSKKDKSRSVEADNIKLKKSQEDFAKTILKIESVTGETIIGLVENRPTHIVKTDQPNRLNLTVAETAKETTKNITKKTNPSSSKQGAIPKSNQQTIRNELKEGIRSYHLGEINKQEIFNLLVKYVPQKLACYWTMSPEDETYIEQNLLPVSREYMTATLEYIDINIERMINGERLMRFGSLLAGISRKVIEAGIGSEGAPRRRDEDEDEVMCVEPNFDFLAAL